jgi:hypothetical protein
MFKQVRPQAAVDEERGLLWGKLSHLKAHLKSGDRELVVGWESGKDDDGRWLTIIYLPLELSWDSPRGRERVGLLERQDIKSQIEEAASVLDYRVEFVDEAPVVV